MKKGIRLLLAGLFLACTGVFAHAVENKLEVRERDNTFDGYIDENNVWQGVTLAGNAGTATALAANGGNCSAGQFAAGVDASGASEGCSDVIEESELASLVDLNTQLGTSIADGAHTAAAHGDGANCTSGQAPLGVDAAGAVQACFDVETAAEATSHEGTADAHYVHATTLAELNTDLGSSIADGAHTSNTDAASKCSGATTYLNGEDGCVELGAVYQAVNSVLDRWQLAGTSANICTTVPTGPGYLAMSTDEYDVFTSTGALIGDWRNSRTGAGACQ